MAIDYNKQTVVQLKKLAADRNISAALKSGLRKADIIEKIEQADANMSNQEAPDPEPEPEPAPAPSTNEEVVEAPAVVDDAIMDEPSNEQVAPPYHESIQPVEQELTTELIVEPVSVPESVSIPESVLIPEPIAKHAAIPNVEEPVPSVVPVTEAEAATSAAQVSEPLVDAPLAAQPSSDLTTPVPTEEIIEDNRKRKRRSATPPVEEAEVATKRQRQEGLQDTDTAVSDAPPQVIESIGEGQVGDVKKESEPRIQEKDAQVAPSPKVPTGPRDEEKWSRDTLFNNKQSTSGSGIELEDDDKVTEPAMHHATAALYIRGLQRPVQTSPLEQRLTALASPPSAVAASDSNVIKTLHLDQVKTHALVLFTSISAASRVRSSLHGRNWNPADNWRKPVWVDFIPEEKVADWIENEERNNEGRTGGRRWEVAYIKNEEGVIEAIHREEGSNTSLAPSQPSGQDPPLKDSTGPPLNAPSGPRGSAVQMRPSVSQVPAPGIIPPSQTETFKTLDELFRFTVTSKPKIYWQPVNDSVVDKRKEELKAETSKDWLLERILSTDKESEYRYSFEGGHKLVHSGPHFTSPKVREREETLRRGGVPPPRSEGRGGGGGGRGGGRFGSGGGRGDWNGYRGWENSYRPDHSGGYRGRR